MLPHAGLQFSGRVAGAVLRQITIPETVIIIGPKHTPHGVDWAVAPHTTWQLPGATVAADRDLAGKLAARIDGLEPDAAAHAQEHCIEVELPLLSHLAPATKVVGIPLQRNGNHFIVDARPAHGRSIRLLIDTGASLTIFTPDVLEQRGIRYQDTGRTGVFNTANGPVRAPIYTLDSLAVGDWHVNHLEIGVLDLGSRSGVDGLLGMNFLNHFQFFIDQNETLLRLSAK